MRSRALRKVDTLGIEPRASRMLSGCDTATPCALPELAAIYLESGCLSFSGPCNRGVRCCIDTRGGGVPSTCGLVAMTSASHAEGRQFDPGQVYCSDPRRLRFLLLDVAAFRRFNIARAPASSEPQGISGLVAEYIVAVDVTRARFPADALEPGSLG